MQSWVRWWTTTIWWQKSASFPVVLLAAWLSSCPPKSVWTQASCVWPILPNLASPHPQSSASNFPMWLLPSSTQIEPCVHGSDLARPLLQGVLGESHVRGTGRTPGRRDHQRQGQRDHRSLQWLPAVQLVVQTVPAELAWFHDVSC